MGACPTVVVVQDGEGAEPPRWEPGPWHVGVAVCGQGEYKVFGLNSRH